jgi:hypothetical protein
LIDKQAAIDSTGFLNTLPRIDGPANPAAGCAAQPMPA